MSICNPTNSMLRTLALVFMLAGSASMAGASAITDALEGTWSGSGTLTLTNGETERIRCRGTGQSDGNAVRQSFKCATSGKNFNFSTSLRFSGSRVSGEWRGPKRSGTAAGQATPTSLRLRLRSQSGTGNLTAAIGACSQSLQVTGWSDELNTLSVQLRKRC